MSTPLTEAATTPLALSCKIVYAGWVGGKCLEETACFAVLADASGNGAGGENTHKMD